MENRKDKKLIDFPKYITETYGAHSSLAKFGFKGEEMYIGYDNVQGFPDKSMFVKLETQNKEFILVVGQVPNGNYSSIMDEWKEFINVVQNASDEEIEKCYRSTLAGQNTDLFVHLANALQRKGFFFPALMN